MRTESFSVIGSIYDNDDGVNRQELVCPIFDNYWTEGYEDEVKFKLVPEPENEHDPNAVAIWCTAPKETRGKLGFIPADRAEEIGAALASNRIRKIELDKMGTKGRGKVWLTVMISIRDKKPVRKKKADDAMAFFMDEDGEEFEIE